MAPGVSLPQLLTLDPRQVEMDPQGTRSHPGDIDGLAASIAAEGLLQPIGIRPEGKGRFRVVYGGRRLAAALHLGLTAVSCLVVDTDGDPLVQQILENVQRRELGDMEKARAFARLGQRLAVERPELRGTALREEVGRRLGISGRTVGRYLTLLDLPREVQELVDGGELTVTQAQHLAAITPADRQVALAREAAQRGLSAAQISRASTRLAANTALTVDAAVRVVDAPAVETHPWETAPTSAATPPAPRRLPRAGADESQGTADEAEFWPDDASAEADRSPEQGRAQMAPVTQDRARVFRVRSLDSFVDEVARLTRCVQDGDLGRLVEDDAQGTIKLELAARQLGFLARAVNELMEGRRR